MHLWINYKTILILICYTHTHTADVLYNWRVERMLKSVKCIRVQNICDDVRYNFVLCVFVMLFDGCKVEHFFFKRVAGDLLHLQGPN